MKTIQRLLSSSAAVVVMVVLALIFGGNLSTVVQASIASSSDCKVHYYNLDGKGETNGSFGPSVTARDKAGIMAELHERRECGNDKQYDPALTAAHYVDWATATLPDGSPANLTSMKVSWENATSFAQLLASNKDVYTAAIKELNELENNASFSIESVSQGQPSAYMATDGHGGVLILQGHTAHDGTNVVFTTKSGVAIRYRLECGFQPNWATLRPNLPECAVGQCTPPPPPPVTPPPSGCVDNCTPPPPPCNPEWEKCWDTSVPAPEEVTPQPNDDYETPDSVAPPAKPAPIINGNEDQNSGSQAPGATTPDPDRDKPDPGTGTDGGGDPGSINPGGPGGAGTGDNNTNPGNPFP